MANTKSAKKQVRASEKKRLQNRSVKTQARTSIDKAETLISGGDLGKAKEWAARSHTEFAEREADEYYRMLSNRIREENIVSQQLPEQH